MHFLCHIHTVYYKECVFKEHFRCIIHVFVRFTVRFPSADMSFSDKPVKSNEKEADPGDTGVKLGRRFHVIWGVLVLFSSSMMIIMSTYSQYLVAHFIKEVRLEWNVTEMSSAGSTCEANASSLSYTVMIESQSRAATLKIYLSMTSGIPSIVVIVLLGAFSDRVGRKVLFLLPLFGFIAMTVTYAVVTYWTLPIHFVYIGHFRWFCHPSHWYLCLYFGFDEGR